MKSCCVLGCKSTSDNGVIYFFEFPTSRALRRKWLDSIQTTGKLTVNSAVCSEHFSKTDYESVRGKVRLKRKVVPSIFHRDELKHDNDSNSNVNQDKPHDETSESTLTADEISPIQAESISDRVKKASVPVVPPKCESNSRNTVNETKKDIIIEVPKNFDEGRPVNLNSLSRLSPTSSVHAESNGNNCIRSTMMLADPDPRQDIEEMITNYHIKNKPNKLVSPSPQEPETFEVEIEPRVVEAEPVFIEVAVGQDGKTSDASAGNRDCLMVLESVQVDVDPSSLMLPDREEDSDDDVVEITKKEDPVSLLTSSDEDEVIIEEPHIDTVEVSDETDEDDIPLVHLATPRRSQRNVKQYTTGIAKIMWGLYDYYCLRCKYNTSSKSDYTKHLKKHETILQVCQICRYTTSSRSQFSRHKRKHKDDRLFKCDLCEYKARHQMSLVYHAKSHEKSSPKRFSCEVCRYETNARFNMKKHRSRQHGIDKDFKTYYGFY